MVEKQDWIWKGQNAAPLAKVTLFWNMDNNNHLPQPHSIDKKIEAAKAHQKKWKTFWVRNQHSLVQNTLHQRENGFVDNQRMHRYLLQKINTNFLKSTISRLNHTGFIIQKDQYFLNVCKTSYTATNFTNHKPSTTKNKTTYNHWSTFSLFPKPKAST